MKNFLFLIALFVLVCSCSHSTNLAFVSKNEKEDTFSVENNQFAFDFYRQIETQSGNLFFSPYSLFSAFAMTANGADGTTAEEMWSTLHSSKDTLLKLYEGSSQSENNAILKVANALWVQEGFPIKSKFQEKVKKDFLASIQSTDYINEPSEALQKINQWVRENTNEKIQEIVTAEDISEDTRLILTNAIYMKAQWKQFFDLEGTKEEPFHMDSTHSKNVPMMHTTEYFPIYETKEMTLLELPYRMESENAPDLSFVLVLPSAGYTLDDVQNILTLERWEESLEKTGLRNVQLSMPKFKIEREWDLNPIMEALGMKLAFTPAADFSKITGGRDLYINKAIHKSFIDVDEKGTEAAAATGVMMGLTSWFEPETPLEVKVDRPFLFFVIDKNTQAIIFMGRVVEP